MTEPRSHRLADLTWPEIAELPKEVAIIPLGACEQHGHGMALRVDTTRAEVVADLVAAQLSPKVVITPAIPVGVSEHHMGFPGTLTLTPTTLMQVIRDIATSLHRHGWRKIFILTGHGGNNSTVDTVLATLRADYQDTWFAWSGITPVVSDVAAELADSKVRGHSCEIETSQALFSDPTLVLPERLQRGSAELQDLDAAGQLSRQHKGIHFPQSYDALSATGNLGDPRLASVEAGARLVNTAAERIAAFLQGLIDLPEKKPERE